MSVSGEQLLSQALDPDDWVDAYGNYLFRYAMSRLGDPSAAEEVLQEAFLAGIRSQDQFAGSGSQRAWLLGILKRKIIDFLRARSRSQQLTEDDELDPTALFFDVHGQWIPGILPDLGPDQQVESQELWSVVQGCLENLPRGQADVFVLSVMEELNAEEICKELDITTSNLWVRLHRARLRLAKCVGAKWFLGDGKGSRSE